MANPPWVSMADIQVQSRKRVLERFAQNDMDLWTGGRDAPHFDIAQLFLKRARELYLHDPSQDPAAWIVKKSALRGRGWTRFRQWHAATLAQSIDFEAVQPFGGGDARRCCVLLDNRKATGLVPDDLTGSSSNPSAPAPPPIPASRTRSVFSPSNRRRHPSLTSPPVLSIETSIPCFARAPPSRRKSSLSSSPSLLPTPAIAPSPPRAQATTLGAISIPRSARSPSAGFATSLPQTSFFPSRSGPLCKQPSFPPMKAEGLMPLRPPIARSGNDLDAIYRELRGQGRNTPPTLLDRIDYNRALSGQPHKAGKRPSAVLHPASGDIMRPHASRPAPPSFRTPSTISRPEPATKPPSSSPC